MEASSGKIFPNLGNTLPHSSFPTLWMTDWAGLFANKAVPSVYTPDCRSAPLHFDTIFVWF